MSGNKAVLIMAGTASAIGIATGIVYIALDGSKKKAIAKAVKAGEITGRSDAYLAHAGYEVKKNY